MANGRTGNIPIFGDVGDSKGSSTKPSAQIEDKYREEEFKGDDAKIILHFFPDILLEISAKGIVTREPFDGPPKRLLINYGEKRAISVEKLIDRLKSKVRDLAEKEVHIPTDKKSDLADFYREYEGNLDVLVLSDIASDKVRIVGPVQEKVYSAAHKLKIKTGVLSTTSGRLNRQVSDPDGSKSSYASIVASGKGGGLYPNIEHLKKNSSVYNNSPKVHSTKSGDYNTSGSSTWRGSSSYRSSSSETFSFERTLKGGLVLKVYKASITRLDVDAIVNAANDTMMHGGGVARVISDAAGYDLDKESRDYVDRRGQVGVSKNIVTTAGRLPYKGVIHAVGPMWHDYGIKTECLRDLYDCVFKILTRCEQRSFRTVGMSAISAGIFAVPKELCADMYVKAAVDFSEKLGMGEYAYPEELHIIDVDESILHLVKASVEKWERNPSSIELDVTFEKYLKDNPHVLSYPGSSYGSSYGSGSRHRPRRSRGYGSGQGGENGPYAKGNENDDGGNVNLNLNLACTLRKKSTETFAWKGVAQVYDFDDQITVKIFKGEIDKSDKMDAIVCGTDKSLQARGFLMDALKKAGGYKFKDSLQKMVDKKMYSAKTLDVFKCDAGGLGVSYIVFIVMDRITYANEEEIRKYGMAVKNILEKAREWKLTQLVIPMFGTGTIQSNRNNLRKCCVALLKGIDSFLGERGNKAKVTDIHLVNNSQSVCEILEEVFDAGAGVPQGGATGGRVGGRRKLSNDEDEGKTDYNFSRSQRGDGTARTYTADGLDKESSSYGEKRLSASDSSTDFSRSRDGRREEGHSSSRDSGGIGRENNVYTRKSSERGRAPSPEKDSAQGTEEKLESENTKASQPKQPNIGNLTIIESS